MLCELACCHGDAPSCQRSLDGHTVPSVEDAGGLVVGSIYGGSSRHKLTPFKTEEDDQHQFHFGCMPFGIGVVFKTQVLSPVITLSKKCLSLSRLSEILREICTRHSLLSTLQFPVTISKTFAIPTSSAMNWRLIVCQSPTQL